MLAHTHTERYREDEMWGCSAPCNTSVGKPSFGLYGSLWSNAGQMYYFLRLHQCLLAPSQRSRSTACNASLWERIWWFPLLGKWGSPVRFPVWQIAKGPNIHSMLKSKSWLPDSQYGCVASQVYSCSCGNRTHLRDLSPRPSWSFSMETHSQRGD